MNYDKNYHSSLLAKGGGLFHHITLGTRATPESVELLREHGFIYKAGRFTEEEDNIIRANWEAYRKENDLKHDDVDLFLPRGQEVLGKKEKWKSNRETHFLPKLCRGLEHRFAQQVGLRFFKLFDPAVRKGFRLSSVTVMNDYYRDRILHLRINKHKQLYYIAEKFRLTITEVRNAVTAHLIETKTITSSMYKPFLKVIEQKTGKDIIKSILDSCAKGKFNTAVDKSIDLDFEEISSSYSKTIDTCRHTWFYLLRVLTKLCEYRRGEGYSEEEALKMSLRNILTKRKPSLTIDQIIKTLGYLTHYVGEETVDTSAFAYLFSKDELEKASIENMVFLFHSRVYTETTYLLNSIRNMITSCNIVTDRIPIHFSLLNKVKILELYFIKVTSVEDGFKRSDPVCSIFRKYYLEALEEFLSSRPETVYFSHKWQKYLEDEQPIGTETRAKEKEV